jgi:hypothetical protein
LTLSAVHDECDRPLFQLETSNDHAPSNSDRTINATRSVEEGADTAVWLANKAAQELTGKMYRDRYDIPW